MTEFVRPADENFVGLKDFDFAPNYHEWQDLRMHYVDEGPRDGPVMLLLHGMPTWSYLYRDIIPPLVSAGYRCIAPDHIGFGRSDRPTDIHWYTIARHTEIMTSLLTTLDLNRITLVCQDWGGPIGLAQAATMPDRFERLVIMNTWLHHPEYEYSDAILNWIKGWHEGGNFHCTTPNIGALMVMTAGLATPAQAFPVIQGEEANFEGAARDMYDAYFAPVKGFGDEAYNSYRRFPLSIPVGAYDNGNGAAQTYHYRTLLHWQKPVNFVWGCEDEVFNEAWGRKWADQMGGTFDGIPDAGHFLQNTHGKQVAEVILQRISG